METTDKPTEMVESELEEVQDTDKGTDGEAFDAKRAAELIAKLRQENKEARIAAKKLQEYEALEKQRKEAEMSDLEKERMKAAELEAKLKAAEMREMRTKIGNEYKLPAEIAELLRGDDDEAMKAHAQKLAAALPKPATLTPTNPGGNNDAITPEQRRAFLYGGGNYPKK